jgi:hypothetical protein
VLALQRVAGNRATATVLGRDSTQLLRAPRGSLTQPVARARLPEVHVQLDPNRDPTTVRWLLEFEGTVTQVELAKALFRAGHPPERNWTLVPGTLWGAITGARRWEVTCLGPIDPWIDTLTPYAMRLRERARGGEALPETRQRDQAAAEAAAKRKRAYNEQYVPALNMTGAEALRTLKPGLYLSAPGKPLFAIPELTWAGGKAPDLSWLKDYEHNGVIVKVMPGWVLVNSLPEGPGHEERLATDIWFLEHGAPTFEAAELQYAVKQQELNVMMIKALAGFYAGAAGVSYSPGAAAGGSLVTGAIETGLQTYQIIEMWREIYKDWAKRQAADKQREHASIHEQSTGGPILQMPVLIDERAAAAAPSPSTAPGTASRAHVQRAAPRRPARAHGPVRARVDGFVGDLARVYRDSIASHRARAPGIRPQDLGRLAEGDALAQAERIARDWNLDPQRIFLGDAHIGVGYYSAEVSSRYYKFMVELKLSYGAVRPGQLEAHFLALSSGFEFPQGGSHHLVTGERFTGSGMHVTDVVPDDDVARHLEHSREAVRGGIEIPERASTRTRGR